MTEYPCVVYAEQHPARTRTQGRHPVHQVVSNPFGCIALKQGAEQRTPAIMQLGIGTLKQFKPRLPRQGMQWHQQGGIVQTPAQQRWVQRFDRKIGELRGSDLRRVDDAMRLREERAVPHVDGGGVR
ncbi:hypothetical protein [Stenotrophomonas sp. RAC2]|uniref:hypothetical protein n=1 Tax=Stenotrophomonas sp. RAC2 TaxID=3064902 RepID=UPI0027199ED3|nr:hypothetical protein [Stenotrophomonas sp. RAC2]MDV9042078.1 hypothetical protein [Stenotrophomonas sp. RAC2]